MVVLKKLQMSMNPFRRGQLTRNLPSRMGAPPQGIDLGDYEGPQTPGTPLEPLVSTDATKVEDGGAEDREEGVAAPKPAE